VGIIDAARRFIDICNPIGVDLVAKQIAVFVIAVEPEIGRRKILIVDEFAFDLLIGEVIVLASILSRL
jgi:hypothetical protein